MKTPFLLLLSAAWYLLTEGASIKIIDGNEAIPHSRPYMALILFETYYEEQICGGSLIKENWVLTAGHCQKLGGRITVILGAHAREERNRWIQAFRVEKSIPHPKFDKKTLHNDLRLLKLKGKATKTKAVQMLPLPKIFKDLDGESECQTAGWGMTEKMDEAEFLLEVNVTVLGRQECTEHWREKNVNITENMMCTSVGTKGQDTCEGDSGGPLICNGVFTGVTSFGPVRCGRPKEASVFTRLTEEYIDWINKTINK